ncbi:zinc finger, CCHC-type containing protein [Tanacetum coccineum]
MTTRVNVNIKTPKLILKKSKVTSWKCGKPGHLKKDCKGGKVDNKANGSGTNGSVNNSLKGQNIFNKSLQNYYVTYASEAYFVKDDDVAWWVDSGATVHVCKDRCWFKTYESLNDGSILYMGNESTALVHRRGCVDLRFSSGKIISLFNVLHVPNIRKNLVSSSVLNNCGYKQVIESNKFVLSKHGVCIGFGYLSNQMFKLNIVNDNIGSTFMSTSKLNDSIIWHARLGHVHYKRMTESRVLGAVVRLPDPKLKTLGERGIECIFVGYAEHSKAFRFSSVPRPSLRIPNGTEDIGGSVAPKEATDEIIQQPEPELKKRKRNRTPKNFKLEFQLYLIEGTMDEVSDQNSYCFNVEDDLKIFDEAMKSCFLKISKTGRSGIQTKVSLIINQIDVKTTFLNGELEEEFYMNQPQGFIMYDNENKGRIALMKAGFNNTNEIHLPVVGILSGWVFLFGGGEISWASKRQTCIIGSTMEYEFITLATAGKEAECAATLTKAYSQMSNRKSRHLGVRHNMIHELITNGVVSIKFMRSQQNLDDHLMWGLAKDLVPKSTDEMCLKSNQVAEC